MPSNLTVPIEINTGAPNVTSEISIHEIVIRPPKGDIQGNISLVIAQGSGDSAYRIPGTFSISDSTDETAQEYIAGKIFSIPVGAHFTDAASASPDGVNMFECVKNACYSALMTRYPDLDGSVS